MPGSYLLDLANRAEELFKLADAGRSKLLGFIVSISTRQKKKRPKALKLRFGAHLQNLLKLLEQIIDDTAFNAPIIPESRNDSENIIY